MSVSAGDRVQINMTWAHDMAPAQSRNVAAADRLVSKKHPLKGTLLPIRSPEVSSFTFLAHFLSSAKLPSSSEDSRKGYRGSDRPPVICARQTRIIGWPPLVVDSNGINKVHSMQVSVGVYFRHYLPLGVASVRLG